MEIQLIPQNQINRYFLTPNVLSVIDFSRGELILPKMDRLCQVKMLFTEDGEFLITAEGCDIKLGMYSGKYWSLNPGTMGQDTQPCFIFVPSKNCWFIHSQGNFVSLTEKEAKEMF